MGIFKKSKVTDKTKQFETMEFRHSMCYIKSASDMLKSSKNLDPRHREELLQGISVAVDKSLKAMSKVELN